MFKIFGRWHSLLCETAIIKRIATNMGALSFKSEDNWKEKEITIKSNIHLFGMVMLSTLLYGSETWAGAE